MGTEFKIKTSDYVEFKKKKTARSLVTKAISSGQLIRASKCYLCEQNCKTNAHHVDYGQPLKVLWLCNKCHGLVHAKDHALNPNNNKQTPMPCIWEVKDTVTVSFSVPALNFIALKDEAKKQKKPFSQLLREHIQKEYPTQSNQLEINFEGLTHDHAQENENKDICSIQQDDAMLPKSKHSLLPVIRRERDHHMPRMERKFLSIPRRHERNAREVQCIASP